MYDIFRIQLAVDIVAKSGAPSSSRDVVPLIRAIPHATVVPHGMQVQWYVNQEQPHLPSVPDFPDTHLVWEVLFNGSSPFRDASYRCALRTTTDDMKTPLVHCAEAQPAHVEQQGIFTYDVRLSDESGRTISLEHAVLIVS
jgi:hypothetical protein